MSSMYIYNFNNRRNHNYETITKRFSLVEPYGGAIIELLAGVGMVGCKVILIQQNQE